MSMQNEQPQPWEQQPDEPTIWFQRFQRWLSQTYGPRSVLLIYKQERTGEIQLDRSRVRTALESLIRAVPAGWRVAVVKFSWSERAEAFDTERFRQEDEERQRRLALLEKIEADRDRFRLPPKTRRSQQECVTAMLAKADQLLATHAQEEEKLRARMRRIMK